MSLLENKALFPKDHDTYTGSPEPKREHKWVRRGHVFICVGCEGEHTIAADVDKFKVDNGKLVKV
jgi:hypothetical protein